jgi:RHS repeat-associated protein
VLKQILLGVYASVAVTSLAPRSIAPGTDNKRARAIRIRVENPTTRPRASERPVGPRPTALAAVGILDGAAFRTLHYNGSGDPSVRRTLRMRTSGAQIVPRGSDITAPNGTSGAVRWRLDGQIDFVPDGGVFSNPSVQVTIKMCAYDAGLDQATFEVWSSTAGYITGSFTFQWHYYDPECYGDDRSATATGTVTLQPGDNWIGASIYDVNGGDVNGSQHNFHYLAPAEAPGNVTVTPKGEAIGVPAGGLSGTRRFYVLNPRAEAMTVSVVRSCLDNASCSQQTTQHTLSARDSIPLDVAYSYSGSWGQTGRLRVVATDVGTNKVDTGTVNLTIGPPAETALPAVISPSLVRRDLCLDIAAGSVGSVECGDLRIAHALPVTTVMGVARVPILTYNSQHASPFLLIPANVSHAAGDPLPGTFNATLWVNGAQVDSRSWPGTDWPSGSSSTRRVTVGFDATGYATGLYPYQLEVRRGPGGPVAFSISDELVIVNRSQSAFGAGWAMAGMDSLIHLANNRKLWLGGDGGALVFEPQASAVYPGLWTASRVDRADSLIYDGVSTYYRLLPDGGRIAFSSAGRHVQTQNRLAQYHPSLYRTTFTYDAVGRLATIEIPTPSAGVRSYGFHYNSSSGKLDSVTAPQTAAYSRTTRLGHSGNRLVSITDAASQPIEFSYVGSTNRLAVRRDRRDIETDFEYDAAGRVTIIRENANGAASAVTTIQALESRSFVLAVALTPAQAYTRVDGPRTDVGDSSLFWLSGYGSARRVRNALGHETLVEYGDPNWPGIATRTQQMNGFSTRAWLSAARSLVDSVTVENPYGDGVNLTTRFEWHTTLPFPTRTIAPDSAVSTVEYDIQGKRIAQQTGTSTDRRVTFGYNAELQLDSIREPGVPVELVSHDALGNFRKVKSPVGRLTMAFKDQLGRDTLVLTPTTSASATDSVQLQAQGLRQRILYDSAGRVWKTITIGPSMPDYTFGDMDGVPAQTMDVENTYDAENYLSVVSRNSIPDSTGAHPVSDGFSYDYAGRVVGDHAGSYIRDPAGNVIRWITQRGDTIATAYDALNRPLRKVIPSKYYTQYAGCPPYSNHPSFCWRFPYYGPLRIERDVQTWQYDLLGNLTNADNRYARVARSYYRNGQIATDTSRIRAYDALADGPGGETSEPADFSTSAYGLRFGYDKNGRRSWMEPPGGNASVRTRYYFSRETGMLDSLRDASGNGFRFTYNPRLQLVAIHSPGSVVETRSYENDGYLQSRNVSAPYGVIQSDVLTYDGRGKVTSVSTTGLFPQQDQAVYSGLGHLVAAQWGRGFGPLMTEEWRGDALGNNYVRRQQRDGSPRTETRYEYDGGAHSLRESRSRNADYCPSMSVWSNRAEHDLDPAGNVTGAVDRVYAGTEQCMETEVGQTRTVQYYSADDRLRVFQRHGDNTAAGTRSVYEEYRYDALGRRVMVRTRPDSLCATQTPAAYCVNAVDRFVWDGDQLVSENRGTIWSGGSALSYAHAGGIDQPVAISTGSTPIIPHANWRGTYISGTSGTGADLRYAVDWPGQDMFAYWDTPNRESQSWSGSLIRGSQDNSGLMYRRNRYYDPGTGRFTQKDPIGVAGGLNVYGYAGGDPVNFADPFGLSPAKIVYGDAAAEAATQACAQASAQCRRMVEELDADDSVWLIETGAIRNDDPLGRNPPSGMTYVHGGPEWGPFEGGVIRIDPSKFAISESNLRVPVNDVTVRSHELGHALIATAFYRGGRNSAITLKDACPVFDCATVIENIVRAELKVPLPLRPIERKVP